MRRRSRLRAARIAVNQKPCNEGSNGILGNTSRSTGLPSDSTVGWINRVMQTQKKRTRQEMSVLATRPRPMRPSAVTTSRAPRYEIVGIVANVADRIRVVVIVGVGKWKFAPRFLQCSGQRAADVAAARHRR
jgi:hypothetical protein